MTVGLFMMLFVILTIASGLATQVMKKVAPKMSANIMALIDAVVIGGAGSVIAYILLGIAFTPVGIAAILLMIGAVFAGSIIGYDKVKQTIEQITEVK